MVSTPTRCSHYCIRTLVQVHGDPSQMLSAGQCYLADLCLPMNDPSDKCMLLFSHTKLHRVRESIEYDLKSLG